MRLSEVGTQPRGLPEVAQRGVRIAYAPVRLAEIEMQERILRTDRAHPLEVADCLDGLVSVERDAAQRIKCIGILRVGFQDGAGGALRLI